MTHGSKTRLLAHTIFRNVSNTDKHQRQSNDVTHQHAYHLSAACQQNNLRIIRLPSTQFRERDLLIIAPGENFRPSHRPTESQPRVLHIPLSKHLPEECFTGFVCEPFEVVERRRGVCGRCAAVHVFFFFFFWHHRTSRVRQLWQLSLFLGFDHAFEAERPLAMRMIVGFASAMVTGGFRFRCANVGGLGIRCQITSSWAGLS